MRSVVCFFLAIVSLPVLAQSVKVSGAMKYIMQKADLTAHARLDTFAKKDLYALGPVAGLKGEIMVLDGTVYSASVTSKGIRPAKNEVNEAAMLVYSHVSRWKAIDTILSITGYKELEKIVAVLAKQQGLDPEQPFVFRMEAIASGSMHIIDWQKGTEHTMDNHRQFAAELALKGEKLELLGFYSDSHHGVFTHHTSNMHIHALNSGGVVGHVDAISMEGRIRFWLPAN
ncbi:MAG TPA: hypothetical protein VFR58_07325 [Flavisolibacter sp.]|nr:hypothetical protein [Flavisolibacter sp.]